MHPKLQSKIGLTYKNTSKYAVRSPQETNSNLKNTMDDQPKICGIIFLR